MGRLQLNERFTQIPNKLLEKLMTAKLTLYELRVTLAIIRKTLGFGKLMDRISEGQISLMTNINRKNVHTSVRSLIDKRIVVFAILGHGKKARKLGIEMDCSRWRIDPAAEATAMRTHGNKRKNKLR